MPWKSFVRGYGSLGGRNGRASVLGHVRYVQRGGECILSETISFGEVVEDPVRIRARWRDIYDQETGRAPLEGVGNQTPEQRKIGPKGRWDGRVMERLAVPLPNGIFDGLDDEEQRRKIRQLVYRLELRSSDVTWALHAGHRQGREDDNLHLHVLYRPRGLDGRKPHLSRRELQSLRTRQLQAITDWVIQQGLAAQVPGPSSAVHLGPRKFALATRGIPLSADDQRMARVLDLANATRQVAAAAARAAWEAAEAGGGIEEAGWRLVQEGRRGTWTLVLDAAPHVRFAVRRLIGIRERDIAERVQAMRARAVEAADLLPTTQPIAQIEIARHPRTGEVAVWNPFTGTILVLDSHGDLVRTVYVRRICPGEIDWTAVGRMAIGRSHLGDGDTCGVVALGHDEERLVCYVEGLRGSSRDIPDGVDIFSRR